MNRIRRQRENLKSRLGEVKRQKSLLNQEIEQLKVQSKNRRRKNLVLKEIKKKNCIV
jgi:hypothetical protein